MILGRYDQEIQEAMKSSVIGTDGLSNIIRYHLGWFNEDFKEEKTSSGKLSRPSVCLAACEAVGGDKKVALNTAVSIQLFHDFTLLHDDIEDHDEYRRHRKTVWKIWGVPRAINVGDALFNLSIKKALETKNAEELVDGFYKIIEGQELDMCLGAKDFDQADIEDYFKMIQKKSAELIAISVKLGAADGGAANEVQELFYNFGINTGLAYQIYDDMVSIWGKKDKSGKEELKDIIERKKTLPLLVLMKIAEQIDRDIVCEIYKKESINKKDAIQICKLLDKYKVHELMKQEIIKYKKLAQAELDKTNVPSEKIKEFIELLEALIPENEIC